MTTHTPAPIPVEARVYAFTQNVIAAIQQGQVVVATQEFVDALKSYMGKNLLKIRGAYRFYADIARIPIHPDKKDTFLPIFVRQDYDVDYRFMAMKEAFPPVRNQVEVQADMASEYLRLMGEDPGADPIKKLEAL